MRSYRQRLGLSINEAALRAGVDESSWGSWERTGLISWKRYRTLVDEFLAQQVTVHASDDDEWSDAYTAAHAYIDGSLPPLV